MHESACHNDDVVCVRVKLGPAPVFTRTQALELAVSVFDVDTCAMKMGSITLITKLASGNETLLEGGNNFAIVAAWGKIGPW